MYVLHVPICGRSHRHCTVGQTCGWVSSTDISLRDPVGSSLSVHDEKSYGWVATLRKSTLLISDFSFIAQNLGVMITLVERGWAVAAGGRLAAAYF